jgi:hypothetical protein
MDGKQAEIQLNTHTMDGRHDPMTRLHHVIPLARYLKHAPAAAEPAAAAPPTSERRKD